MVIAVHDTAWSALVLVASALAISRRNLMLSAALCCLALFFLGAGFAIWLRTE